jgi:hypothetical protein
MGIVVFQGISNIIEGLVGSNIFLQIMIFFYTYNKAITKFCELHEI